MDLIFTLSIIALFFSLLVLRKGMIDSFKISYYEQKLKNRGVDISSVSNITLLDILRM